MQFSIAGLGHQDHALGFYATYFAWFQIGEYDHMLPRQFFWFVMQSNAADDCSLHTIDIQGQLQQFISFRYAFSSQYCCSPYVQFCKIIIRDIRLVYRRSRSEAGVAVTDISWSLATCF